MAKNWAILVGINDYDYSSVLGKLHYAQRDAEQMYGFLVDSNGPARFDLDRVYLFSAAATNPRFRPTKSNLTVFLGEISDRANLTDGDNLWFFFSGHGLVGKDGRDYLMPVGGHPSHVADTGIAVDDIVTRLRGSGADNIVMLLDACRDEANPGKKAVRGCLASRGAIAANMPA